MSRTNETRHIKWHETCKSICRLDKIIGNSKQRWNEDKLIKVYAIKDMFGIRVIASVNVINLVILVNILIIKAVSVEKN